MPKKGSRWEVEVTSIVERNREVLTICRPLLLFLATGIVADGPDGVLMIDSQFAPLTDKIVAAIRQISSTAPEVAMRSHQPIRRWPPARYGVHETLVPTRTG